MKSQIISENGTMMLKINDEKMAFSAYRSFHPQEKYLKQFAEHGYILFNVFPSGIMTALADRTIPYSQFGPVWIGENEYNWDNFKKQTDLFNKTCPNGYAALMIHLDTPDWFIKQHPECDDTWETFVQGASSALWRNAALDYMIALIDKAEELMPEKIFGYYLMCGGTTEWYTRELEKALKNPTESHLESYRAFLGDPNASVPDYEEFCSVQNGIFTENENVINYRRYLNTVTADTLLFFANKAKEHTKGERVVCTFFGYTGADCSNIVRYSYNESQRIFESSDINIITGPASYNFRKLSSTSAFRISVDSLTLNNKLYVHEIDSKTHLTHKNKLAQTHMTGIDDTFKSIEETTAYLRREVAMVIAKGHGFWLFDMFGGWFDAEDMMEEIENLKRLADKMAQTPFKNISEAALFIDLESGYYIGEDADYPVSELQIREMNLCGFPWDMYITHDLLNQKFDFDRYKLYIFPNLFKAKPEIAEKIKFLRESGKSILFMHAPGYLTDVGYSEMNVKDITGINLKRCGFDTAETRVEATGDTIDFTREVNAWRKLRGETRENNHFTPIFCIDEECVLIGKYLADNSVSIGLKPRKRGGFDAYSAIAPLDVRTMKQIAREVGVFSYINTDDVVYLNSAMLAVYSLSEGTKTLFWKDKVRATDYYTKQQYVLSPEGTDIYFKKYETKIFLIDGESVL
ncbi:MAG: hypothetical protein ACI4DY_07325 [Monoglobaceae bacterium]